MSEAVAQAGLVPITPAPDIGALTCAAMALSGVSVATHALTLMR